MKLSKLLTAVFTVSMLAACTFSHEKWSNFDNQSSHLRPNPYHIRNIRNPRRMYNTYSFHSFFLTSRTSPLYIDSSLLIHFRWSIFLASSATIRLN